MSTYHITLSCSGLTTVEGSEAPPAIVEEFNHRPWHQNVTCKWDGSLLWLEGSNDYDKDGRALLDEFRDGVVASVRFTADIHFNITSVQKTAFKV